MTNEELFRAHWNWLAENGHKSKRDWPRFVHNGGTISTPLGYCYACESTFDLANEWSSLVNCKKCPIVWTTKCIEEESLLRPCLYRGSPYTKWCAADTVSEKEFFAKIIAKMPWHERSEIKEFFAKIIAKMPWHERSEIMSPVEIGEPVEVWCCGVKIILRIQRAGQEHPTKSDLVQVRGTILLPTNESDNHLMWELRFDERIPTAIMREFLTATWGTYNEDFGFRESAAELYTGKTWKVAVDAAMSGLQVQIEPLKAAIKNRHQALIDAD